MKKRIRLTESGLRNFIRETITKRLLEDMNMDQYSEFNYDELAQHLEQDLKEYGIIYAGQTNGMDQITLEFPNEWYITLEFNFNDDGSFYYVYIETDETDKDIIRLTGTPYHEIYRLGEGDEFDYDTLLEYVKEILDRHNNAIATLGKKQNENLTRRVTERVLKKLNESVGDGYDGDRQLYNLILEAQSVADNLIDWAEKIYDDIEKRLSTLDKNSWKYNESHDDNTIYFQYSFYGQTLSFTIFVYNFKDTTVSAEDEFHLWAFNQGEGGCFVPKQVKIYTNAILFNGVLQRDYYFTALVHELEHAYQFALKKAKAPNKENVLFIPPIYYCSPTPSNSDYKWETKKIKDLIYYLEPQEQDAYLQQFYSECKNDYKKFTNIKDTYIGKTLDICQSGIEVLKRCIDDPNMTDVFNEYRKLGYSPQRLLKYCQNGYDRLYKKYMRVYGRLKSEWDEKLNK